MNPAFPAIQASGRPPEAARVRRSDKMLADLLALNEEMITQLRLERLSTAGTTDFIAGMIDQHELAASELRSQLRRHEASALSGPAGARAAIPIPIS